MTERARFGDLIQRIEYLRRDIRRKKEQREELEAAATSTGSFRYDQDRVTGSAPDGSRQENLIVKYVLLEKRIEEEQMELKTMQDKIRRLIRKLPPRERDLMKARQINGASPEEYAAQRNLTRDAYVKRYQRAAARLDKMLREEIEGI